MSTVVSWKSNRSAVLLFVTLQIIKYRHGDRWSRTMSSNCRVLLSASAPGSWASLMTGCDCGFWGVSGMGAISLRCSTKAWRWEERGQVKDSNQPLADTRGRKGERRGGREVGEDRGCMGMAHSLLRRPAALAYHQCYGGNWFSLCH